MRTNENELVKTMLRERFEQAMATEAAQAAKAETEKR